MALPPAGSVKTERLDPNARICGEIVFVHPTRGGERYISPAEQERAIRSSGHRLGVKLIEPIVVEENVSGSLPAEKRKLGEVLLACEEAARTASSSRTSTG